VEWSTLKIENCLNDREDLSTQDITMAILIIKVNQQHIRIANMNLKKKTPTPRKRATNNINHAAIGETKIIYNQATLDLQ
jgi:hypothetical protein